MLGQIISQALTLHNVLIMNLGITLGIVIGAMPGLSLTFAVTVVLTLTYGMDSMAGMYLLLGTYVGGMYGGSIIAILINTPGTSNAAATVFDGYPLAQQGRAGDALRAALLASTIGGMFSAIVLLFLAPQVAKVVLLIGSPEYFALCVRHARSHQHGGQEQAQGTHICRAGSADVHRGPRSHLRLPASDVW